LFFFFLNAIITITIVTAVEHAGSLYLFKKTG
jgi:hypothetical protein